MKNIFFTLIFTFSSHVFAADLSASKAAAVLEFAKNSEISTVVDSVHREQRGSIDAALTYFESCNISINGCYIEFFISQTLQSGDQSGPRLISAKVGFSFDGTGEKTTTVTDVKVLK